MSKKIIIFLIILIAGTALAIFWNWQRNAYSKEVLKLEILGPTEANLGEEVEYVVKYKNNGNFRLEEPKLIFTPPETAVVDEKIFGIQTLEKDQLGEAIYPGEEKNFSFKMRLLGKEGELKTVNASLSYKPKNLKARYESSTSFTTTILSIPVTFEFDLPTKIESGKILISG